MSSSLSPVWMWPASPSTSITIYISICVFLSFPVCGGGDLGGQSNGLHRAQRTPSGSWSLHPSALPRQPHRLLQGERAAAHYSQPQHGCRIMLLFAFILSCVFRDDSWFQSVSACNCHHDCALTHSTPCGTSSPRICLSSSEESQTSTSWSFF